MYHYMLCFYLNKIRILSGGIIMWETIQYGMLFLLIAFFIYLMYKNDSSSRQNKTEYPNHYMNTKTKKKVCQVYCNDERGVNNWLKLNSDVEIVGIKIGRAHV